MDFVGWLFLIMAFAVMGTALTFGLCREMKEDSDAEDGWAIFQPEDRQDD